MAHLKRKEGEKKVKKDGGVTLRLTGNQRNILIGVTGEKPSKGPGCFSGRFKKETE